MTPLVRWIRDAIEGWLERRYEGPDPPDRFAAQVVSFAEFRPMATRREWVAFATAFARETYRAGWTRGFEWAERDKEAIEAATPDELADAMDPGWREWSAPVDLSNPLAVVPEVADEVAALRSSMGANGKHVR